MIKFGNLTAAVAVVLTLVSALVSALASASALTNGRTPDAGHLTLAQAVIVQEGVSPSERMK